MMTAHRRCRLRAAEFGTGAGETDLTQTAVVWCWHETLAAGWQPRLHAAVERGGSLSELGSQTSTVAYPLLILGLTGSAAKAGVVGLAKWLPLAVFALPAGVLADRVDRKRLMISCEAGRLIAAASIVVALTLGRPAYLQIIVVAFIDGALLITSSIGERGALRQVVAAEHLQDAVAHNEVRTFTAGIVGPSLGGLLFSLARALPFVADAASFLCSMTAISLTKAQFQTPSTMAERSWRQFATDAKAGFSWLRSRPFFRTTSLLFAAGNPVFTGLYLLAILLAKHHGASSATVGAMFAIVGAGGLLGAILAGPIRRRLTARAVLVGEEWLLLGVILVLLVAHDALLIGLLLAAAEFATPATNAIVGGSRIAAAPDDLQGRIQAASNMLAMSLAWLGPLAIGYAFQHTGPTTTILLLAAWTLTLAITATAAPSLHDQPATVPGSPTTHPIPPDTPPRPNP
jgi:predicted MFS family arabinose efflux permease